MYRRLALRILQVAFLVNILSCKALGTLAEFDPKFSGVHVDNSVAPADGLTAIHVTVQLRYAAAAAVQGVTVNLTATGASANLKATTRGTDTNGIFSTTLTSATPGVVRLAANIRDRGRAPRCRPACNLFRSRRERR